MRKKNGNMILTAEQKSTATNKQTNKWLASNNSAQTRSKQIKRESVRLKMERDKTKAPSLIGSQSTYTMLITDWMMENLTAQTTQQTNQNKTENKNKSKQTTKNTNNISRKHPGIMLAVEINSSADYSLNRFLHEIAIASCWCFWCTKPTATQHKSAG